MTPCDGVTRGHAAKWHIKAINLIAAYRRRIEKGVVSVETSTVALRSRRCAYRGEVEKGANGAQAHTYVPEINTPNK